MVPSPAAEFSVRRTVAERWPSRENLGFYAPWPKKYGFGATFCKKLLVLRTFLEQNTRKAVYFERFRAILDVFVPLAAQIDSKTKKK